MTRVALAAALLLGALPVGAQQLPDAPPAPLSPPELLGFVPAEYPPEATEARDPDSGSHACQKIRAPSTPSSHPSS